MSVIRKSFDASRQATAARALAAAMFLLAVAWMGVDAAPLKIMPLGDSRTAGPSTPNCYRIYLDSLMKAGGYSFDLVGYRVKHVDNNPVGNYDYNHQGMWGWIMDMLISGHPDHVSNNPATDELGGHVGIWARGLKPDVVLALLGGIDIPRTPPVNVTSSNDSILLKIGVIIDSLRIGNSQVTILLGNVYPFGPNDARLAQATALNARFPAFIATKTTATSSVILVDTWTGFNNATMLFDDQHANAAGCRLIAQRWFDKLKPIFATASTRGIGARGILPSIAAGQYEGTSQPWMRQTAISISGRVMMLRAGTFGEGVRVRGDSPSLRVLTSR